MATIVTPQTTGNDSSGLLNFVLALFVVLVMLYMFFVYALPAFQQMGAPQINVPDKIDVNVQQPAK